MIGSATWAGEVGPSGTSRRPWADPRLSVVIPVVLWVLLAVYVAARIRIAWNLHDEGVLGQSAERVLAGELPHRDFDDVYTGGLSDFHALVFQVLGTNLLALRIALWVAYVLWLPAVFYIATRFARPIPSALATSLAAVWSVPNALVALPSWYNLFLATAGAAAMCRYAEVRGSRWLFLAGLAGGLSVLAKVVGFYYLAAVGLVLLRDGQRPPGPGERSRARGRWYAIVVTMIGLALIAGLWSLLRHVSGYSQYWHFLVPTAALVLVLIADEWRARPDPLGARPSALVMTRILPVALGVALPIACFLIPYIASGTTSVLVRGVFGVPERRFQYAVARPESLRFLWAAAPLILLFVPPDLLPWRRAGVGRRLTLATLAVALLVILGVAAARGGTVYRVVWLAIEHAGPLVGVAGALYLYSHLRDRDGASVRTHQIWIVLSVTALCSLIRFPYAGSHYVSYIAPLVILSVLAIVTSRRGGAGALPALAGSFFFLFAVLCTNPGHYTVTGLPVPRTEWPTVRLHIPRTGLDVGASEASMYERIVGLVTAHSAAGAYIYAAVDLPEVYFLAQRHNPTRTLYDFLDSPDGHDARVIRALDAHDVRTVVVRGYEGFSPAMDTALATTLRQRFPDSEAVGPFVVRWRDGSGVVAVPIGRAAAPSATAFGVR